MIRTLVIAGISTVVVMGAAAPALADHFYGGPEQDHYAGTAHSDLMYGYGDADRLEGRGGDDYLYGGGGPDVLNGDAGWDEIYDGKGADVADGGGGNDDLYDGPGVDRLKGGPGNDYFGMDHTSHGDRVNCGAGRDTVTYDGSQDMTDILVNCERIWIFD